MVYVHMSFDLHPVLYYSNLGGTHVGVFQNFSLMANYCIKRPSPDVLQVIVDVAAGVFDVDGHVGRLQHLHGELMGEGSDKQSPQSVLTADLSRHPNLLCLLSILQVQHT